MRKLIVSLLLAVLGVLLIVFFVANRHDVLISFDPFSLEDPAFAIGPMPMWAAMAATLGIGYGLGAVGMWLSDGSLRKKAKERKREIKRLKTELKMTGAEAAADGGTNLPAVRG